MQFKVNRYLYLLVGHQSQQSGERMSVSARSRLVGSEPRFSGCVFALAFTQVSDLTRASRVSIVELSYLLSLAIDRAKLYFLSIYRVLIFNMIFTYFYSKVTKFFV